MSTVTPACSASAPISAVPDERGRFGEFGRRYVPETLMYALEQLTCAYEDAQKDPEFDRQLRDLLKHFVGRPNPLYFAERLTEKCGGARIYFKREDLNHTGAHKINNTMGQVLLTKRMGKTRVIAETGAGQHGVATATACARFGLPCVVYMGEEDVRRQKLNVFIMRTMGAEVRPVTSGSRTLRDAINEAMRDWMSSVENIYPFHFSDGDNWSVDDTHTCVELLKKEVLPFVNLFSYGQVESPYGSGQFIKDLTEHFDEDERVVTSEIKGKDAIMDSIKEFLGKGR